MDYSKSSHHKCVAGHVAVEVDNMSLSEWERCCQCDEHWG